MNLSKCVLSLFLLATAFSVRPTTEAHAQVGELDPTFDTDGIRTDSLSDSDQAGGVAVRNDGTIYVVGTSDVTNASQRQASIVSYDSGGNLLFARDYPVHPFGCFDVPEAFFNISLLPSDELVAVGYAQYGCTGDVNRDFYVVRISVNGDVLDAFDRPVFHGHLDNARVVETQTDGKFVVAGFAGTGSSATTWDWAIARYTSDGEMDSTFSDDGELTIDFDGDYDFAESIAIQSDGKILVSGFATNSSGDRDFTIVRLESNGTLDSTFDGDGILQIDFNGYEDRAAAIALQSDGKIAVAGIRGNADLATQEFIVARLESNGSFDTSFGTGGVSQIDFGEVQGFGLEVAVLTNGKIVAAGLLEMSTSGADSRDFGVARVLSNGTLDSGFSTDGKNVIDIAGGRDQPGGLAIEIDGDVLISGYATTSSSDFAVVRLVGDTAALPVELTTFEARVDGADVLLTWATASEVNSAGFDIEGRATTDELWSRHATVSSLGTDNLGHNYNHQIRNLQPGQYEFRLRQFDLDGTSEYSPVIEASVLQETPLFLSAVSPNPVADQITVSLSVNRTQQVELAVFDLLGRQVLRGPTATIDADATSQFQVDVTNLTSGVYFLRLEGETRSATRRFVRM